MKYTVDFLENKKVLVGGVEKEVKEGTFTDESGNTIKATIWRFDKDKVEFPNYAQIAPGSTLDANPWSKEGSTKITLYAPKIASTGGFKGGAGMSALKTAQIEKTMEKKEQSISKFQDNKEWSIKVSSTMRDAVLLSIAESKPTPQNIAKWREWLWNNWDVADDQYPPFMAPNERQAVDEDPMNFGDF